jgi:hypothetical protein
MGCNCKNDKNNMLNKQDELNGNDINHDEEIKNLSLPYKVIYYGVRTFGFILSLLLIPIINIVAIWFLFKTLVLNKKVNVLSLTKTLTRWKKMRELEEKEKEEKEYKDFEEAENKYLYPVNKIKSTIE